jgi:hypothetical protein
MQNHIRPGQKLPLTVRSVWTAEVLPLWTVDVHAPRCSRPSGKKITTNWPETCMTPGSSTTADPGRENP